MGRQIFQWTETNENLLLAHLDFVIEKLRQENRRYLTKEEVLRSLESELPQPKPSRGQIQKRLWKIWTESNPKPKAWFHHEDIIIRGTITLVVFDEDRRKAILEEVNIIRETQKEINKGTPRKTRSGKVRGIPSSSAREPSATRTPTKAKRKQLDQTPNENPSKRTKIGSGKSKVYLNEVAVVIPSRPYVPTLRISTPVPSTANDSESVVSGRSSVERSSCEKDKDTPPSTLFQWRDLLEPFLSSAHKSTVTSAYNYSDRRSKLNDFDNNIADSKDEMLLDLFNDNWHLRKELEISKRERRTMIEDHRVRQLLDSIHLPKAMEEQNQTIIRNQRLIDGHQFARHLFDGEKSKQPVPTHSRIEYIHDDMRKNILNLSAAEHTLRTADDVLNVRSEDFEILRDRVLSGTKQPSMLDDMSLSLDIWVQSLVGAAICEWIFADSYKGVAVMNTPLLYAYREALNILCPEDILTKVESVAHQCLVDNPHFKEVFLRRTAERFANRLLTAMTPLLKDDYLLAENSIEDELSGIFLSALEIKMLGMIPSYMFELIWPSRNAKFNGDLMTEDTSTTGTKNQELWDQENRKVMLTLVPGIKVYNCDREHMDSRSFTTGEEHGLGEGDFIIRARVLTEKAA